MRPIQPLQLDLIKGQLIVNMNKIVDIPTSLSSPVDIVDTNLSYYCEMSIALSMLPSRVVVPQERILNDVLISYRQVSASIN
jgi:hypothetical protein